MGAYSFDGGCSFRVGAFTGKFLINGSEDEDEGGAGRRFIIFVLLKRVFRRVRQAKKAAAGAGM